MNHTLCNHNVKKLSFEDIFRHALDQQIGGQPVGALDLAYTRQRVDNAMLSLIKRRGLLDVLLSDLGLCSLCHERKNQRRLGR